VDQILQVTGLVGSTCLCGAVWYSLKKLTMRTSPLYVDESRALLGVRPVLPDVRSNQACAWIQFFVEVQRAFNAGNEDYLTEITDAHLHQTVRDRIVHRAHLGRIGIAWVDAEWAGNCLALGIEKPVHFIRFNGEFTRIPSLKLKRFSDVWTLVCDGEEIRIINIDQRSSLF